MTEEIFDYKKECSNLLAEKNALLCRYEEIRAELQKIREGKCTDCIQHLITDSHKKALAKTGSYIKALEEIREMINEVCWDYTDITISTRP